MADLNPQILTQLRVVAESPGLVSCVAALRAAYKPSFRADIVDALNTLEKKAAGRQVITIFQMHSLCPQPESFFEPSMHLLDEYEKLKK